MEVTREMLRLERRDIKGEIENTEDKCCEKEQHIWASHLHNSLLLTLSSRN